MTTASEVIRDALQEINVQSAEQPLNGDEVLTGIRYMNRMVASWPTDIGYTVVAASSDVLTVPTDSERAIVLKLAIELAPQFDVPVSADLRDNASDAYKNMLLKNQSLLDADYGSNLPLGSGNTYPGYRSSNFYTETDDDA